MVKLKKLRAIKNKRYSFQVLSQKIVTILEEISEEDYNHLIQELREQNSDILTDGKHYFTIGQAGNEYRLYLLRSE